MNFARRVIGRHNEGEDSAPVFVKQTFGVANFNCLEDREVPRTDRYKEIILTGMMRLAVRLHHIRFQNSKVLSTFFLFYRVQKLWCCTHWQFNPLYINNNFLHSWTRGLKN
jgi:hypothetical protein